MASRTAGAGSAVRRSLGRRVRVLRRLPGRAGRRAVLDEARWGVGSLSDPSHAADLRRGGRGGAGASRGGAAESRARRPRGRVRVAHADVGSDRAAGLRRGGPFGHGARRHGRSERWNAALDRTRRERHAAAGRGVLLSSRDTGWNVGSGSSDADPLSPAAYVISRREASPAPSARGAAAPSPLLRKSPGAWPSPAWISLRDPSAPRPRGSATAAWRRTSERAGEALPAPARTGRRRRSRARSARGDRSRRTWAATGRGDPPAAGSRGGSS